MTYQDDPNLNRPAKGDEPNYLPWTIAGAVALAVILGIILLPGRTEKDSTVASNPSAEAHRSISSAPIRSAGSAWDPG